MTSNSILRLLGLVSLLVTFTGCNSAPMTAGRSVGVPAADIHPIPAEVPPVTALREQQFGDWTVRCQNPHTCWVYHDAPSPSRHIPRSPYSVSIGARVNGDDGYVLQVLMDELPKVEWQRGLIFIIDGREHATLVFQTCKNRSCRFLKKGADNEIVALARASEAAIRLFDSELGAVQLRFSPHGLDAALKAYAAQTLAGQQWGLPKGWSMSPSP